MRSVCLVAVGALLRGEIRGKGCSGADCGPFPWSAPEPPNACSAAEKNSASFCADASSECACRRDEAEQHVKKLCADFTGVYEGCKLSSFSLD